jgi:predicted O-methyltransferase YrrM
MNKTEYFSLAERVKGFLDPAEGRRLHDIALKAAELGPGLEIGSYCGKSTIYLAAAFKEKGGVFFSLDHHRGSEEQQPGEEYFDPDLFTPQGFRVDTLPAFRRTLGQTDLEGTVVALVCPSAVAVRAWTIPLSLVFIDGGHAYQTVRDDYEGWARHLLPGGYLLIHDIFKDPAQGGQAPYQIYQDALASGQFKERPMTKTLGILQRTDDPSKKRR